MDFNGALTRFQSFYQNAPTGVSTALFYVCVAISAIFLISVIVAIVLAVKYFAYNRHEASCGLTGRQAARRLLDSAGLKKVKISASGSLLFGNSYSPGQKRIRLRYRTINQTSIASVALGSQKAALAMLDKEGDEDMVVRRRLGFLRWIGPYAFLPLLILGFVIDMIMNTGTATYTVFFGVLAIVFYTLSFFRRFRALKSESKAQERACRELAALGLATDEEIGLMRKMYRLYNIEYINSMILAMLEVFYFALQLVAFFGKGKK